MLTIKQAKSARCNDLTERDCKCWHRTCRRCELHGYYLEIRNHSGLCKECHKEYEEWYEATILRPAIQAFRHEMDAGFDPDWSPYWLAAAYTVWMKQAPIKNRAVVEIEGEVII